MDPIAFLIKHAVVDPAALAVEDARREQQDKQRKYKSKLIADYTPRVGDIERFFDKNKTITEYTFDPRPGIEETLERARRTNQRESEIDMLELSNLIDAYEAGKKSPIAKAIGPAIGLGLPSAVVGALIGSLSGRPGRGALIGGGLMGLIGGGLGATRPGRARQNLKDWHAGKPMVINPLLLPSDDPKSAPKYAPLQEVKRPISPRARAVLEKVLAAG